MMEWWASNSALSNYLLDGDEDDEDVVSTVHPNELVVLNGEIEEGVRGIVNGWTMAQLQILGIWLLAETMNNNQTTNNYTIEEDVVESNPSLPIGNSSSY
eukprot:scaffold8281_cov177-Ochromonas_danica.AAC.4